MNRIVDFVYFFTGQLLSIFWLGILTDGEVESCNQLEYLSIIERYVECANPKL